MYRSKTKHAATTMNRSVRKRAAAMLWMWVYFSTMRAMTSVPPEEAPTLNSRAEAMAGRAMAKIRSSMGWSERGPLRGQIFSKTISSADMTREA